MLLHKNIACVCMYFLFGFTSCSEKLGKYRYGGWNCNTLNKSADFDLGIGWVPGAWLLLIDTLF